MQSLNNCDFIAGFLPELLAGGSGRPVANFFMAGDGSSRGGVRLTAKDLDGDDRADLIVGSGDGLPSRIRVYRGATLPVIMGLNRR